MNRNCIPTTSSTEGGQLPVNESHPEFRAARTVNIHVDAAITAAHRGTNKDLVASMEKLLLATSALRGVRSPRIKRSWVRAIDRTRTAILGAYEVTV